MMFKAGERQAVMYSFDGLLWLECRGGFSGAPCRGRENCLEPTAGAVMIVWIEVVGVQR